MALPKLALALTLAAAFGLAVQSQLLYWSALRRRSAPALAAGFCVEVAVLALAVHAFAR